MRVIFWLAGLSLLLGSAALNAQEPAPAPTPAPTPAPAPAPPPAPSAETGAGEETDFAPADPPPAATETAGPIMVAVPNMRTSGVDADLASTLTDVLTVEANKAAGIQAIGMADIEAVLGIEEQKQLLGCDDVSCMAEIGGALGVNAIIASKLGKVGDTYILTVRAIDTKEVRVLGSTQETVAGKPDALIAAARRAVPAVLATLVSSDTAIVAGAAESPEVKDGGVHWPGTLLTIGGGILAAAGIGLGVLAGFTWSEYISSSEESTRIDHGGIEYTQSGAQSTHFNAQAITAGAVAALGLGAAMLGGGLAWQMMGGAAAEEGEL